MIVIVNLHLGNLGSIRNMLRKLGADAVVSDRVEDIEAATRLILPGVGAFDGGIQKLDELGLRGPLTVKVMERGTPAFGVCLGMQLLGHRSEEGESRGLGWVDMEARRFRFEGDATKTLRIPHVGWNYVDAIGGGSAIFAGLDEEARFYFTHSYHASLSDDTQAAGVANYGYQFVCAVRRRNVWGVQFHPEKSYRHGLKIYENFLKFQP